MNVGAYNLDSTENENQMPSFKRKLGNKTYTVKVHFSEGTEKTFKDRGQRLIAGGCTSGKKKNEKYPQHTQHQSEVKCFPKYV